MIGSSSSEHTLKPIGEPCQRLYAGLLALVFILASVQHVAAHDKLLPVFDFNQVLLEVRASSGLRRNLEQSFYAIPRLLRATISEKVPRNQVRTDHQGLIKTVDDSGQLKLFDF